MQDVIELKLATVEDAMQIYKMQQEAFMPLYEKYHDDETSPVKETLEKIRWKITEPDAEFYIIRWEEKAVGAIRIRHHQGNIRLSNVNWIRSNKKPETVICTRNADLSEWERSILLTNT